ncbi:hypothetical protein [Halorubrum trueperi]|uniref:DUF8156 domain-containing protein n=1 Tax=Halorubrum trueperi TaxID=2004704 RepID=A0ABD5UQA6_9EURY
MGRTNPTFRDLLSGVENRWQSFRRVLRRRDQPRFDRLFEYAREHADAAGMLNHESRTVPVLVSIDLEQERRIDELEDRIEQLERAREVAAEGPVDDTPPESESPPNP